MYEALIRYLNSIAGENLDDVKVIKVAPTGKAAYNIKGNTVHSAFQIPAKRWEYCSLDSDRLNTIRSKLRNLKVIIFDEISMVGCGMFNLLNLRLQQILENKMPFGGISLIAVGDVSTSACLRQMLKQLCVQMTITMSTFLMDLFYSEMILSHKLFPGPHMEVLST